MRKPRTKSSVKCVLGRWVRCEAPECLPRDAQAPAALYADKISDVVENSPLVPTQKTQIAHVGSASLCMVSALADMDVLTIRRRVGGC